MWRFLQDGMLVAFPVIVTVYTGIYLLKLGNLVGQMMLPDRFSHFRGGGLLVLLLLVVLAGLLWSWPPFRHGVGYCERKMLRVPAVSSYYRVVKEITRSAIGKKDPFTQVVLVQEAGCGKRIGLLTAQQMEELHLPKQLVAVYLPFGTQLGGDLLLLPKESLEPVDMTVEAALRFCMTAGVSVKD
ncbi:hypothetical protein EL26_16000 [Tumebacillus flagellatus]|uniref:DUF502 domain-containing protein n=1 Tax=Tumebacillus flagellatus TaxID=1157490 RepID=A0A074LP57_9BACL|nr:hypothetical protein EL26_16000 [Tumebacillus flagellatus]